MKGRHAYDLPHSMQPIIDVIGRSATISLAHVYGGCALYVPRARNIRNDHPLAELLGLPLAHKLANAYAGTVFDIPRCVAIADGIRHAAILRLHHAGTPAAKIATRFGVTVRSVRMTIARQRNTNVDKELTT